MTKISFMILVVAAVFSACKEEAFKKGQSGLEYKIIGNGKGEKLKDGQFMQIQVGQYYNTGKKDSMMTDTRTSSGPMIEMLDTVSTPPAYYEILKQLRKDDSLVMRIMTDSAFAKSPQGMPAFFKKGHYLITTVKVLNVFTNREQADSARNAEMANKKQRDSIASIATTSREEKTLTEYFKKNNIQVVKAPLGTYVEIIQPGTGATIDTSVVVVTNYTGKTMDGKMFDSNTDPSKGHVEPLNVNMTNDMSLGVNVIAGWKDGLSLLNKGSKAKFYIPSALAYGANPPSAEIAPYSILVFDIEVLDVLNRSQASVVANEKKKKMQEMQKRYMDSMRKVQPDSTKRNTP